MKKIITFALCLGAVASMGAQKTALDAAKKLSGKLDKVAEARAAIQEAIQNPETGENPETYFIAGKIEFDAFEKANTKAMTDKNYKADENAMGEQLLNGYDFFMKGMALDNATGKPKFTGKMVSTLQKRAGDYWNSGAYFFNNKKYPEANKAFYDFGEIAANNPTLLIPDSTISMAYSNAGIAAFSADNLQKAIEAFAKARSTNAADAETYTYEIACWQNLAQRDSTITDQATTAIYQIANEGLTKFGTNPLFFLNNIVSYKVDQNKIDEALAMVDEVIANDPNNSNIYGLRAFVNDRAEKQDAAEADYRKALSLEGADFDTLKNASIFLYKKGTELYNKIDSNTAEARAAKTALKDNYFTPASQAAEAARKINPSDSRLNYIIDSIDYAISTYF